MTDVSYLIAMGANLPGAGGMTPSETLRAALKYLEENGVAVEQVSRFYSTPAFPAGSGPDFVNAAARLRSKLSPVEMMRLLHQIELDHGRERRERWAGRCLDLDLLAAGKRVFPDEARWREWADLPLEEQLKRAPDQLVLPHPRIQDRGFVLVPLADVAATWRHPVLGQSVTELLSALGPKGLADIHPV